MFSAYLNDKLHPDALVSFIKLSKDYYHCDFSYSSHHRPLKLPETRQSIGRSVDPALISQEEKIHPVQSCRCFDQIGLGFLLKRWN